MEAVRFVSLFDDFQNQSGRIFIDELETAFEIGGIVEDKLKKFLFKLKLRGLPSEWYETIRDDEEYKIWDCIKVAFLQQFDRTKLKPKDVMMRLMNIRQSVEKNESIQSLSIRIMHLFNDYKQIMRNCLTEQEKIEYFIESLSPSYKKQLNNLYQSADGVSYLICTFNDVLATALKLERNARVFEEDVKLFPSDVSQLRINAVYKAVNFTTQVGEKEAINFNKIAEEEDFEIEIQNTEDIKKIQKDQVTMKDQLEAVTTALQHFGDEMKLMKQSIENLCYERVDCLGRINPMDNHCYNLPFRQNDSRKFNNYSFTNRYDDPRLYNAPRANDGQLQGSCYKCEEKDHYAKVCRAQISNEEHMDQRDENANPFYLPAQSELIQFDSLSEDESNQLPIVNKSNQENGLKDLRVRSGVNISQEIRSMSTAITNEVSNLEIWKSPIPVYQIMNIMSREENLKKESL